MTATLTDILRLGKARLTLWCCIVAAGTYLLAIQATAATFSPGLAGLFLLGTALTVMAASGYNMVWERELDGRLERTRERPVASGRMRPATALIISTVELVLVLGLLFLVTNPVTAGLACAALGLYVLVYTPLKAHPRLATLVGSLPGALPAVMGWSAVTATVHASAVIAFLILVFWQLPHTLVISSTHRADSDRARVPSLALVLGDGQIRIRAFAWTALLFSMSLLLVAVGSAGVIYFVVASGLGGWLVYLGALGLDCPYRENWAGRYYRASLAYLPLLMAGLVLDRLFH